LLDFAIRATSGVATLSLAKIALEVLQVHIGRVEIARLFIFLSFLHSLLNKLHDFLGHFGRVSGRFFIIVAIKVISAVEVIIKSRFRVLRFLRFNLLGQCEASLEILASLLLKLSKFFQLFLLLLLLNLTHAIFNRRCEIVIDQE